MRVIKGKIKSQIGCHFNNFKTPSISSKHFCSLLKVIKIYILQKRIWSSQLKVQDVQVNLLIDCARLMFDDFFQWIHDVPFDLCCAVFHALVQQSNQAMTFSRQMNFFFRWTFTDDTNDFLDFTAATFPHFRLICKKLIINKRDNAIEHVLLMFTTDRFWQVRRLLLPSIIPFTRAHLEMSKMFPFIKTFSAPQRNVKFFVFATLNNSTRSCLWKPIYNISPAASTFSMN